MNFLKLLVLATVLILSACSAVKESKEAPLNSGINEVTAVKESKEVPLNPEVNELADSPKVNNIESKELLLAKQALSAIHSLEKDDDVLVSRDSMAREPFVQRFSESFPSAEVRCHENNLEGKAAEVYKNISGDEYYAELCEFYIENNHLANIEFMYEEKGGGFLGMSNSELTFK
jgi:hypothetical protein